MDATVPARNWRFAALGFAGALCLIAAVELFSFQHSRRVEAEIGRLTYEAERSTFLIGDVGQQMSRLQMSVVATLSDGNPSPAQARARFHSVDADLQKHLTELQGHLCESEREVWARVEPEIADLRASLSGVLDLLASARAPEANAELNRLADPTLRCFDSLQAFLKFNQIETHRQMDAANTLLGRTRVLQGVLATLLFVCIAGAGLTTMRVIRRKDAELESYLRGVERDRHQLIVFAGRVAYDWSQSASVRSASP